MASSNQPSSSARWVRVYDPNGRAQLPPRQPPPTPPHPAPPRQPTSPAPRLPISPVVAVEHLGQHCGLERGGHVRLAVGEPALAQRALDQRLGAAGHTGRVVVVVVCVCVGWGGVRGASVSSRSARRISGGALRVTRGGLWCWGPEGGGSVGGGVAGRSSPRCARATRHLGHLGPTQKRPSTHSALPLPSRWAGGWVNTGGALFSGQSLSKWVGGPALLAQRALVQRMGAAGHTGRVVVVEGSGQLAGAHSLTANSEAAAHRIVLCCCWLGRVSRWVNTGGALFSGRSLFSRAAEFSTAVTAGPPLAKTWDIHKQ